MKKILCMILAAMMIASVSVNAVEVDEEVNDVEVVETVEDMPDEDVAEVADVDEPEDTPDEAPADLEDLPDLEDPVIDEPEDYPDADPDDEIVPVVLAAYSGSYKVNTLYNWGDNIQWIYKDGVLTFSLKDKTKKSPIEYGGDTSLIFEIEYNWVAPWEELITQGYWSTLTGIYYDITKKDDLPLNKIVFEEGITELPSMGFNLLRGDITVELPSTLLKVDKRSFDGWSASDNLKCTVNFHGSLEQWKEEVTIESGNTALELGSTSYFYMYIPDVIELTPEETSFDQVIYISNRAVAATIKFEGTGINNTAQNFTVNSDTPNIKNGGNNNCIINMSCSYNDTQTDATYNYGELHLWVSKYTDDYQDYECSGIMTFDFKVS